MYLALSNACHKSLPFQGTVFCLNKAAVREACIFYMPFEKCWAQLRRNIKSLFKSRVLHISLILPLLTTITNFDTLYIPEVIKLCAGNIDVIFYPVVVETFIQVVELILRH